MCVVTSIHNVSHSIWMLLMLLLWLAPKQMNLASATASITLYIKSSPAQTHAQFYLHLSNSIFIIVGSLRVNLCWAQPAYKTPRHNSDFTFRVLPFLRRTERKTKIIVIAYYMPIACQHIAVGLRKRLASFHVCFCVNDVAVDMSLTMSHHVSSGTIKTHWSIEHELYPLAASACVTFCIWIWQWMDYFRTSICI